VEARIRDDKLPKISKYNFPELLISSAIIDIKLDIILGYLLYNLSSP
jgi:hypothetical protein